MGDALQIARSRYTQCRISLDAVLCAVGNMDARMAECKIPSQRALLGSGLFMKTLLHARSLALIIPPIGGAGGYDLSSAAVLTRAIAETFVAMRYTCSEPDDETEFAFRLALLEFHQRATQCRQLRASSIAGLSVEQAIEKRQSALHLLERSSRFQELPTGVQTRLRNGRDHMHRSHEVIAKDAGIDPAFWVPTYIFLSQFAHSSPLGVRQVMGATSDRPIAASNMALFVGAVTGLLAKVALDLILLVPQASASVSTAERNILEGQSIALNNTRYGDLGWPQ